MKQTVTWEFEENDFELLKEYIKPNPCNSCPDQLGCCGCSKYAEWLAAWDMYKQANMSEIKIN